MAHPSHEQVKRLADSYYLASLLLVTLRDAMAAQPGYEGSPATSARPARARDHRREELSAILTTGFLWP